MSNAILAAALVACVGGCSAGAGESLPTAPAPSNPSLREYPTADTTGVPDGVRLVESESIRIDDDGAVVDGLEVHGTVTVRADDVVIRNTRIISGADIPIRVVSGSRRLVIEDSEIDGRGEAGPAIAFSDYTLRRVHIHDVTEGPRIAGGRVTIEYSLLHRLVVRDENHADVVQVVSGSDILVRGNWIEAYNPTRGSYGNAAFMFGSEDGPVRHCRVIDNFMNGGNFTVNGGGGGTTEAACAFDGNTFGRDFRYGIVGHLGPAADWSVTNVWLDTGDPAP